MRDTLKEAMELKKELGKITQKDIMERFSLSPSYAKRIMKEVEELDENKVKPSEDR